MNAPRFCIARDGAKWRVYDDQMMRFAEPMQNASDKASARERAHLLNQSPHYASTSNQGAKQS